MKERKVLQRADPVDLINPRVWVGDCSGNYNTLNDRDMPTMETAMLKGEGKKLLMKKYRLMATKLIGQKKIFELNSSDFRLLEKLTGWKNILPTSTTSTRDDSTSNRPPAFVDVPRRSEVRGTAILRYHGERRWRYGSRTRLRECQADSPLTKKAVFERVGTQNTYIKSLPT
ncbi:hypothetical protein V1478_006809 [Vespula squamosa]|uniref:Uncharacterized protein n=1 Tax=Vespula squamosa TaxID=30214 RepID=A0ABD2B189_VESSQ